MQDTKENLEICRRPEFFVIGAGRSGTTSLHRYLSQHPQLFLAPKNPSFFYACDLAGSPLWHDRSRMPSYFVPDEQQYSRLFADAPEGSVTGEVSPVYLASTSVAPRMAKRHPSAKVIAVLRNPVDRVYSRYVARHRDGLEKTTTFEELVDREMREPLVRDDAHASYLPGGMTGHFLRTYFDRFPRENIAVYFYEDFAADTAAVMRQICRFLQVREDFSFDVSRIHNRGGGRIRSRSVGKFWAASEPLRRAVRPLFPKRWRDQAFRAVTSQTERIAIRPETRRMLAGVYREDIKQIQDMTGRNLSAWL